MECESQTREVQALSHITQTPSDEKFSNATNLIGENAAFSLRSVSSEAKLFQQTWRNLCGPRNFPRTIPWNLSTIYCLFCSNREWKVRGFGVNRRKWNSMRDYDLKLTQLHQDTDFRIEKRMKKVDRRELSMQNVNDFERPLRKLPFISTKPNKSQKCV